MKRKLEDLQRPLLVNEIIHWENENQTERLLYLDNKRDVVFAIDIYANTYSPVCRRISDINDSIERGVALVLREDPWAIIINEEEIKLSNREKRDKAWDIVSLIISISGEPQIYNPEIKIKCIKEASEKFGIAERTIYEYLRKYWQRGKTKNALLPDFYRCGGKGKEKISGENKRGRPRKYNNSIGINIDDEIKKIFRIAINKFYLTTKENSFATAYTLMLKEYFTDGYRYDAGVKKPIILDDSKIPSLGQFRYWYQKNRNIQKEVSARRSSKRYFLENRAVLGDTTSEVFGVGAVYEIDSTQTDIYLVSAYARDKIIGRATLYNVIDVYSHMIVGISVTIEPPSYKQAMIALYNTTMNKVEFCKRYGIHITESEWPVSNCIPCSILADRGELEGKGVEGLVSGLSIKVSNTASYRGDCKSNVERSFGLMFSLISPHVPGAVGGDFQMRGGKDYRLEAKLDVYQLTQIMIKCAIYHNNHRMESYKREELLVIDDIPPIPTEIWNWGIQNKSGKLRSINQDIVRLNLMPRAMGTITGRGLKFKGVLYGSKLALQERWFEKANNEGSWKVEISYDPQDMDNVYILLDGGKDIEKCFLLNHEDRYKNKTLEEIEFLLEYEKMKSQENKNRELQSKVDLIFDIEAIVKNAEMQSNQHIGAGESNAKKLKGIRKNRAKERVFNSNNELWNFNSNTEAIEENQQINMEDDYSIDEDIQLIKKVKMEKLKNDKIDSN